MNLTQLTTLNRVLVLTKHKWMDFKLFDQCAHEIYLVLMNNSYFYIEKWTFKIMCEVCYRAKRDKKEAT